MTHRDGGRRDKKNRVTRTAIKRWLEEKESFSEKGGGKETQGGKYLPGTGRRNNSLL